MRSEWPYGIPQNVEEANRQAAYFHMATGQRMMLNEAQWSAFERAGFDMTLYQKIGRIPKQGHGEA